MKKSERKKGGWNKTAWLVFFLFFFSFLPQAQGAGHFVLDVSGYKPPGSYMQLSIDLIIDGQVGQVGDEIGIFHQGVLCGAYEIKEGITDHYCTVYNNQIIVPENPAIGPTEGSILEVKIWDESEGREIQSCCQLGIQEEINVGGAPKYLCCHIWAVDINCYGAVKIFSIDPNQAINELPAQITITGVHFLEGLTVSLQSLTETIPLDQGTMTVTPTAINAVVPNGLVAGNYDVIVQNPDGVLDTLPGGFKVNWPAPAISQVIPTSGLNNSATTIVFDGNYFNAKRKDFR